MRQSSQQLTGSQAEILRLLRSGNGRYRRLDVDDMEWVSGEPKGGYFAEEIDLEPLCGQQSIGYWRVNSRALSSLIVKGYCDNGGITEAGRLALKSHSLAEAYP